jgi:cephalosporin-C deacetylase-like acetyl esterase
MSLSLSRLCSGILPVVGVLLSAQLASAQSPGPKAGDIMIEKYLAQETGRVSQRVLAGATTLEQWQAIRPRLRQEYLDMLGLWPLPEKTPLAAKITGTVERDGVVIDKLHFQSRPGLYVTGNLYRPRAAGTGKLPGVLYVCGHSNRGRDGNKTAFQDHGMWFAANGYVCLMIDTLQLGEIPGIHHGTYGRPYLHLKAYGIPDRDILENRWWWQAAGYTPAGVECWNGVRAIDYLISRPDVDPERIAVTGISGGGAATGWIAAADERVRVAVPVSGISDLESYVSNKVINGHCDCMFLINAHGWEWTTIPAIIAPRPLLFANSDNDGIFPMDGNRRIIARLRSLYALYGKPDLVDEHVSKGGHDYRPDLRIAIFGWINKHLNNDSGAIKDADFKPLPGKELRVFVEDKDVPADAINARIDETFVPRAQVDLPREGGFVAWKTELLQQLRQRSFRAFPTRIPEAVKVRTPAAAKVMTLVTEPGIELRLANLSPEKDDGKSGTLVVLGPEEESTRVPDWAKPFTGGGAVMLLPPRGIGETAWTEGRPPNYVDRAHALLGRTVDQGRVWDIAATVRYLHATDGRRWQVAGRGQSGILAAYAALFEPSVAEVVAVEPPASHREGPIFLNVLRVLDIPDALGLLAPTPLTLVNAKNTAFEKTARIYQRAGMETKLQRK